MALSNFVFPPGIICEPINQIPKSTPSGQEVAVFSPPILCDNFSSTQRSYCTITPIAHFSSASGVEVSLSTSDVVSSVGEAETNGNTSIPKQIANIAPNPEPNGRTSNQVTDINSTISILKTGKQPNNPKRKRNINTKKQPGNKRSHKKCRSCSKPFSSTYIEAHRRLCKGVNQCQECPVLCKNLSGLSKHIAAKHKPPRSNDVSSSNSTSEPTVSEGFPQLIADKIANSNLNDSTDNPTQLSANNTDAEQSPLAKAVAKRMEFYFKPSRTIDEGSSTSGPLYKVEKDSLILDHGACKEEEYNKAVNWNGVVPVVVHPELVYGIAEKPKPLSKEQIDGLTFLWDSVELSKKGAVLAHDMGLGKTRVGVTLIATLSQQSSGSRGTSKPGLKKCIIIAPKNAISVWDDEFKKWCPKDVPCKVETLRPWSRDGWGTVDKFKDNSSHVLILSYETFQKYNSTYAAHGFQAYEKDSVDIVICDEAHTLKNKDTGRYRNLKKFVAPRIWIGVTGTPYQNNLEELCSLAQFFRRDLFGDSDYKLDYCRRIMHGIKSNGRIEGETKELLSKLRDILLPVFHFRKNDFNIEKHDVTLCIPLCGHPKYWPTSDDAADGELLSLQYVIYKGLAEQLSASEINSFEKLSYFHKACIHPLELRKVISENSLLLILAEKYDSVLSQEDLQLPVVIEALPAYSAKITVVTKMALYMKEKLPDEKMIIISNSTVLLQMLKRFLNEKHNLSTLEYDGKTSDAKRKLCLDNFQSDDSIQFLLLSLKAGGTALTLTRANHLVLMDPDYNPANDRQALARIYRPSQERAVFIYRLLLTGTIEEKKYVLQMSKEEIGKSLMPSGSLDVQIPFIQNFFEYDENTLSFVKDEVDRVNLEEEIPSDALTMDTAFAEELYKSKQYKENGDVPIELPLVKHVWDFVSYAFHIPKIVRDKDEELVVIRVLSGENQSK